MTLKRARILLVPRDTKSRVKSSNLKFSLSKEGSKYSDPNIQSSCSWAMERLQEITKTPLDAANDEPGDEAVGKSEIETGSDDDHVLFDMNVTVETEGDEYIFDSTFSTWRR